MGGGWCFAREGTPLLYLPMQPVSTPLRGAVVVSPEEVYVPGLKLGNLFRGWAWYEAAD